MRGHPSKTNQLDRGITLWPLNHRLLCLVGTDGSLTPHTTRDNFFSGKFLHGRKETTGVGQGNGHSPQEGQKHIPKPAARTSTTGDDRQIGISPLWFAVVQGKDEV